MICVQLHQDRGWGKLHTLHNNKVNTNKIKAYMKHTLFFYLQTKSIIFKKSI
jgi:hypothetical protein